MGSLPKFEPVISFFSAILILKPSQVTCLKHGYKFRLDDFTALSFHPLIIDKNPPFLLFYFIWTHGFSCSEKLHINKQ
jgi:hypothetical protein